MGKKAVAGTVALRVAFMEGGKCSDGGGEEIRGVS